MDEFWKLLRESLPQVLGTLIAAAIIALITMSAGYGLGAAILAAVGAVAALLFVFGMYIRMRKPVVERTPPTTSTPTISPETSLPPEFKKVPPPVETAGQSPLKELEELIEIKSRRLHKLRVRAALMGIDAPPQDRIEIEDIEKQLEVLEQRKQELFETKTSLLRDEIRRLAEDKKAIEAKLAQPFRVTATFSNRSRELNEYILSPLGDPFSKPFIIINAPVGYGKSHLLREVKRRLEQRGEIEKWIIIPIECHENDTEVTLMAQIAQRLGSPELVMTLTDLAPVVGGALDDPMTKGLVLLFDGLDRWKKKTGISSEWLDVADFVKQKLLSGLNEIIVRKPKKVKLSGIFAGRYVGDCTKGFPFLYKEVPLSPFDKEAIRIFILETMDRWQKEEPIGRDYSPADLERFAEEMLDVTGGHPGAIARIVQDVADKKFDIILDDYFALENKKRLFEKFVSGEIPTLLEGVPLSLQEPFQVVSIFRRFNADTLDALVDEGHLLRRFKDGWELYRQMLNTHLIEPAPLLFSDKTLQRVLNAKRRSEDIGRYRELQQFAVNLYDWWLQGQDHKGQALPGGPPSGSDQISLMVEGLYHLCGAIEGEAGKPEKILEKLEMYLKQLRYPFGHRQGADALKQAIEVDEQLPVLLKRALSQEGYCTFLTCIKRSGEERKQ